MAVSPRQRDKAALLLIFGCFFLVSPFISAMVMPRQIFGMPVIVLYVFGVWILLIALAARISTRLARAEASSAAAQETAFELEPPPPGKDS